jgi:hypothetical protein
VSPEPDEKPRAVVQTPAADPLVEILRATIAAASAGGGGRGPSNTVIVLVALVALLAGWSARQAITGDALTALVVRIEAVEKRQRRLGQAQAEALYLVTDNQRWHIETIRWLAQQLVPGAEPPPPPDHRIQVREIQRLLGQQEEEE